ncbi:hypothetical protein GF389_05150 [Candidatus Dojkabacteria bacterium]|nr:hypothetical protein [Candidatus Dojkabacteria bacterium]
MDIKERDGYFMVKCKDKKAVLAYKKLEKVADDANMYVNFDKKDDRGYFVYNPGEYEVNEIFCMALGKKRKQAYLVDICGVSLLLIPEVVELNEKDLEQLGSIDILIVGNGAVINSDLVKYVGRIDPQLLLLHKDSDKDEMAKTFGVEIEELNKKLKVKASEFDNEDYKMQLLVIN